MVQRGRMRWGIGVLVALVPALHASPVRAASGLVSMEASAKMNAKGCGKYAGNASVELTLADDGTWRMTIEDDELTGSYEAGGKGDRTLTLTPAARTRIVTSPVRGVGSGALRSSITSGGPAFGIHTAFAMNAAYPERRRPVNPPPGGCAFV